MINPFILFTLPVLSLLSQDPQLDWSVIHLNELTVASAKAGSDSVFLRPQGNVNPDAKQTFVVTHGCGGTKSGDRFHILAGAIKALLPEANVYLVDWSSGADKRMANGLPNPWHAARNIDVTGDVVAKLLKDSTIDPASMTLIGESFGVYVNHRVVQTIGKVRRVLALNPASEQGGYLPPLLENDAERVFVFTTGSIFDTQLYLASRAVKLVTGREGQHFEEHRFGVEWLIEQVRKGTTDWLELAVELNPANQEQFSASVSADGKVVPAPIARLLNATTLSLTKEGVQEAVLAQ